MSPERLSLKALLRSPLARSRSLDPESPVHKVNLAGLRSNSLQEEEENRARGRASEPVPVER